MEYLGMKEDPLYLATAQSADDVVLESRQHAAGNFVEGRVCEDCNNRWMSALETEAMPILKPLIDGTVSLMSISDAERAIVAKWATKTAYVTSHAAPLKKTPDPSHLRYMKENAGAIPPRVEVFGSQIISKVGFGQIQRNHWFHLTNAPPIRTNPPDGTYKTAIQFRCLMLLVAHWSAPNTELLMAAGIHIPLWPIRQVNLCYHVQLPTPTPTSDPMAPLDRFCSSLAVCDADFSQK
jgi:hypothetical protein